ncbi:MAG: hypothetical protein E7197_07725 [Anaerovibrio sp.]|nr:hypothetical protein [Anaerovibrio sp.]
MVLERTPFRRHDLEQSCVCSAVKSGAVGGLNCEVGAVAGMSEGNRNGKTATAYYIHSHRQSLYW